MLAGHSARRIREQGFCIATLPEGAPGAPEKFARKRSCILRAVHVLSLMHRKSRGTPVFKRNLRRGEGTWLVGQEAKTLPSHGRIMGSIPVRATRKHLSKERCFFVFFNDFIIKTFRKSFTITLNIFSYFPGGSGGAEALRNPAPPRVKMKRNDPRRRPDRKRCPARVHGTKGFPEACPTSSSIR